MITIEPKGLPLFQMAKARNTDPVSSRKAAEFVNGGIAGKQDRLVFDTLAIRGNRTAKEIEIFLDGFESVFNTHPDSVQITRALSRLRDAGLVETTGEYRKTNGRSYQVWKVQK